MNPINPTPNFSFDKPYPQYTHANLGLFLLCLYTMPVIIVLVIFFLCYSMGRMFKRTFFNKNKETASVTYRTILTLWPFFVIYVFIFFCTMFPICNTIVFEIFFKYLLPSMSDDMLGVILQPWTSENFTRDLLIPPADGQEGPSLLLTFQQRYGLLFTWIFLSICIWLYVNIYTFFYITTRLNIHRNILVFFVYLITTTSVIGLFLGTCSILFLPDLPSRSVVFTEIKNKYLLRYLLFFMPIVISAVMLFFFQFYYFCKKGTLYNIFLIKNIIAEWVYEQQYPKIVEQCHLIVMKMACGGVHRDIFVFKHFFYFFGIPVLNLLLIYAFIRYNLPLRILSIIIILNLVAVCYRIFFAVLSLYVNREIAKATEKYKVFHIMGGEIRLPEILKMKLRDIRLRPINAFDKSFEFDPELELETRQQYKNLYVFHRCFLLPLSVGLTGAGALIHILRFLLILLIIYLWHQ